MVGSWYLTHATKNVVWIFTLSFFVFFFFAKENARIMHEQTWKQKTCSLLKKVCWTHMHDDAMTHAKSDAGYMITDKCMNAMSITMPWRDAYAMHDMNEFTDTRARKIISSYLHIWGCSAPCVQLRGWYGFSGFPWQKTRPTYNACMTTWCRHAKAQHKDVHSMEISTNNHTTKAYMTFRLYAWQCLKGTQRVRFVPLF